MTNSIKEFLQKKLEACLSAKGEMGTMILQKDWTKTPLGDPVNWPSSLSTTVSVILDTPIGMCIAWGEKYTQIYNDAFRPFLGASKHPFALGNSAAETYSENWEAIKPIFEKVMQGASFRDTDVMVPLNRNGFTEDCYFDLCYSPVRNDQGDPAGVLITAIDTSSKKKARDELLEANERMEYATKAADIATWVFDPQNETFSGDAVLRDWFGLPEGNKNFPLGLAMEKLIPQDKERIGRAIKHSLTIAHGIIDQECTIVHPQTHESRIIRVKGKAVFNDDKVAYKLYGILQDVTSQTLAGKKLEESNKNFASMVAQAPFSIAVLAGPKYEVVMVNDKALHLWRREREEVFGKALFDVMPELLNQGIKEILDDVYSSGQTFTATEMPLKILEKGNLQDTFLNFNYQPLLNSNGKTEAILAIGVNVTDLVKARRDVEESEKRIRSIVESAPFPIGVYIGKEMRIELANQSMLDTWGKGNDVIGKLYADVLPELSNQQVFEQLEKVFTTGEPFHAHQQKIDLVVDDRLQTFYFNYSFTPLRNISGEVYGVMNTGVDVTDLVYSIQQAEKSEEQLRVALAGGELGTFDYYPLENKLSWSDKAKELFGLPPEAEVNYETYLQAIHVDDNSDSLAVAQHRFPLDENGLYELVYRTVGIYDQKVRWVRSKGKATYNEQGIPIRYTGVVQEITKLKEAEAETKKLTDILESSREFIALANLKYEAEYVNPAGLKMLGWESYQGRKITDCVYPEDIKISEQLLSQLFIKGFFNHEIRFRNEKTGEPFWIQWNGIAIKDHETKAVVALATVSPNITDRKKAEEALKESEAKFRAMADNISHLAWVAEADGSISWYNKKWYEYTGTSIDEVKGWGWQSVHDPERLPEVLKNWKVSIQNGRPFEMVFPIKGADGNFREFLTRILPIKNDSGEIIQWFGTNTDITERIKAEQELKESEARFRSFADSMPQIVWAADKDGNLSYINRAFYQYSGLSPSENIQEEFIGIIHADEREETLSHWNELSTNAKAFNFEHRFRRYDGEYRWQLSRAVPLRNAEGNIETWVGTSTDIQEIKELDQQKDHFISIASHELKTPITSIKGYVQILESIYSESGDAFLKKSLAAVDKQIVKLTNLIGDLLDLSKLKLGNLYLVKEPFNLSELVEEVVEEMRLVKRDYSIDLNLNTDVLVVADRERIAQVLVNFLTNAIKYSPRNKVVKVESFVKDNYCTVVVIDRGIGINKQSQEKVFERFYRVEGKSEKTYPGFGIGLFISSEIIQRHNGKIGVRSNPGEGSEFYFSLPVI